MKKKKSGHLLSSSSSSNFKVQINNHHGIVSSDTFYDNSPSMNEVSYNPKKIINTSSNLEVKVPGNVNFVQHTTSNAGERERSKIMINNSKRTNNHHHRDKGVFGRDEKSGSKTGIRNFNYLSEDDLRSLSLRGKNKKKLLKTKVFYPMFGTEKEDLIEKQINRHNGVKYDNEYVLRNSNSDSSLKKRKKNKKNKKYDFSNDNNNKKKKIKKKKYIVSFPMSAVAPTFIPVLGSDRIDDEIERNTDENESFFQFIDKKNKKKIYGVSEMGKRKNLYSPYKTKRKNNWKKRIKNFGLISNITGRKQKRIVEIPLKKNKKSGANKKKNNLIEIKRIAFKTKSDSIKRIVNIVKEVTKLSKKKKRKKLKNYESTQVELFNL